MKTTQSAYITLLLSLLPLALGQAASSSPSLPPSPTASVGCVPHGDHWDCEGPHVTSTTGTPSTLTTSVTTTGSAGAVTTPPPHDDDDDHDDHDDDHDEDGDHHDDVTGTGAVSLKPSPTESIGCVPHGDHWDCTGPATATQNPPAASTTVTTSGGAKSGVTVLGALFAAAIGAVNVL